MMFVAHYPENEATLSIFTQNWNVIKITSEETVSFCSNP